jgi:hypothetical protein
VLACGKNLHGLGAGSPGEIQQAGMQALCQEKVRGENSQHKDETPRPRL